MTGQLFMVLNVYNSIRCYLSVDNMELRPHRTSLSPLGPNPLQKRRLKFPVIEERKATNNWMLVLCLFHYQHFILLLLKVYLL